MARPRELAAGWGQAAHSRAALPRPRQSLWLHATPASAPTAAFSFRGPLITANGTCMWVECGSCDVSGCGGRGCVCAGSLLSSVIGGVVLTGLAGHRWKGLLSVGCILLVLADGLRPLGVHYAARPSRAPPAAACRLAAFAFGWPTSCGVFAPRRAWGWGVPGSSGNGRTTGPPAGTRRVCARQLPLRCGATRGGGPGGGVARARFLARPAGYARPAFVRRAGPPFGRLAVGRGGRVWVVLALAPAGRGGMVERLALRWCRRVGRASGASVGALWPRVESSAFTRLLSGSSSPPSGFGTIDSTVLHGTCSIAHGGPTITLLCTHGLASPHARFLCPLDLRSWVGQMAAVGRALGCTGALTARGARASRRGPVDLRSWPRRRRQGRQMSPPRSP